MQAPRNVLIIKTGFSEFLDRGISPTVSLGDVLICTALLHIYNSDNVVWMTSWAARPLLKNNPYIKELLIFGPPAFERIRGEPFDILINLEKDIGICTYLSQVKARKRFGFYFSEKEHDITTHKRSTRYLLAGQENHRDIEKNALEILFETVDRKWDGEGLILSRKRRKREIFDFGFNYAVGSKWPTKAWPMEQWKSLEQLLQPNHTISWQKGHKDLSTYIDWIDSCRVIVTSDSLGQAIGQALGKKVITLYGSTNYRRVERIPGITPVMSTLKCTHMPCFLPICKNEKFCMDFISPERVAGICTNVIKEMS